MYQQREFLCSQKYDVSPQEFDAFILLENSPLLSKFLSPQDKEIHATECQSLELLTKIPFQGSCQGLISDLRILVAKLPTLSQRSDKE
jgi:hypothetical protein